MEYNKLKEGMRFRFPDGKTTWTLTKKFTEMPDYSEMSMSYHIPMKEEMERFRLTPDNGGTDQTYDGWSVHKVVDSIIYHPKAGFSIGDYFEIKREGLEPDLRGRLLEIDPEAEMWPYRVGQADGPSVWFSWKELTKIHSVVSRERSPKAVKSLKKQIAEKREELEALETALEVLEYASV